VIFTTGLILKMASDKPSTTSQDKITETLKSEYLSYLAAQDRKDDTAVEAFMSPSCWQLARQNPAWNLQNRDAITSILISMRSLESGSRNPGRGKVEMRALSEEERGTLPEATRKQALEEGWKGLYVVLEDAKSDGRIVKVRYWFRIEEGRWVQCLHDLLWVGPKDGKVDENVEAVFGTKLNVLGL
jgi:hypothetical protein